MIHTNTTNRDREFIRYCNKDINKEQTMNAKEQIVEDWNNAHEPGTAVTWKDDSGEIHNAKTRSYAEVLGGHTPVIWLTGMSGCYALERVIPV